MASAEERRRLKELDEARKAGLAPAELDEDGKEINPHIPEYMTSAPWYLNKDKPTLQHQRNWRKADDDEGKWYERGVKVFQATKWRKGACENCGSLTHKTKDCLERPRSKGAKFTNKNIAADDLIQEITPATFDAKRDRWNGYDSKDYTQIIDRHEQLDGMRKDIKQKEMATKLYGGNKDAVDLGDLSSGPDDDDEKIKEEEEAGFADVTKRVRTAGGGSTGSVRNLRIREDTAKYLFNLDVDSAYYDPKSRSMREDPQPDRPLSEKVFLGDNFARKTGDYLVWQQVQVHAVKAQEKGVDLNALGIPSLAEKMYQQFKAKKETLNNVSKEDIMTRYGDAGEKLPEDLLLLQGTEKYVEYDRLGRVVKGQENQVRSRYEEDVHPGNHTSVWGSWWGDGQWGYACCHQCVKNSYCTGKAGEKAVADVEAQMIANVVQKAANADADLQRRKDETKLAGYKPPVDVWGSDTADVPLDDSKVKEALAKLEKAEREALASATDKRKYHSLDAMAEQVTPEEMEAWRIKRSRVEDPVQLAGSKADNGYEFL
mmetsp:Transcript_1021/g.1652  ORF Transcript_1021/g.1652 Transcript_1021/m.1652 type:complete len:544 (+) Transcript_1021:212-1843(+)|eukprot:CAMPEP_0119101072 /NCGR_PEP_ID=MMETSP1180-20130426/204_1 /TAXON_ID=3052 ORGANISM="Chlamydomonas cf sp, Strain CCMP681" /NCGR_SAMPLE_ID=MMETSP1180 /ASSEMBLY_ACC=CAM_ASM_000741 /LENGTH=543 /DNA_ID=CAMNT_0007085113 /DNA_START=150 /DNA_END=1781 /DNA_ORIENTATION=-